MANSKYNQVLFVVAEDLGKLVSGEITSVDLANFKLVGARKQWADAAEVINDSEGVSHVVKTINVHMIAIGDVLGSLGYNGPFHLDNNLVLSLAAAPKKVVSENISLAAILAKIAAAKVVTEPVAEVTETETTEHATE